MDYLKDKQHHIDRYDLITIKRCLEVIDVYRTTYKEMLTNEQGKKFSPGEQAKTSNWMTNQHLFIVKAERYSLKEETIQKWLDQDRTKQEKYDDTPEPQNVRCPDCKKPMRRSLKQLEMFDDPLRMMFLFNCTSCKKKRWIYEDGTEYEPTPQLCPKCKAEIITDVINEGKDKLIFKKNCPSCGFTETITEDFAKSRAERLKQEEEDKKLLEECREEFCSEEKGKEAFEYIEASKVAKVVQEEELKKYDSLAYQKVSQLKKLTVIELEKLLNSLLEKWRFVKLSLEQPQMGPQIIVPFNVQDSDSSRRENSSVEQLQKLIKETLEGTNWRLMTDGVSYRLGYLSGRLKGYEREEDLFEISGKKKEEESSVIDYETRTKYEGHKVVQLARMMGEQKGIENARKRRLEKEPEGFFLEESDEVYTCNICGENNPTNECWWNLNGVRCKDCHRNIKEGVIPAEIRKYDDTWVESWHLTSKDDFNLRYSIVSKLRKEGILKGRDLKREDGVIYLTVYLIEENKEFLEKYPRKPRTKHYIIDLLGNQVEL